MQLVHGRLNRPEKCNLCKCFGRHVNNVPPLEFGIHSRQCEQYTRRQCEMAVTVMVELNSALKQPIIWFL